MDIDTTRQMVDALVEGADVEDVINELFGIGAAINRKVRAPLHRRDAGIYAKRQQRFQAGAERSAAKAKRARTWVGRRWHGSAARSSRQMASKTGMRKTIHQAKAAHYSKSGRH
jgi:hypothetical protein